MTTAPAAVDPAILVPSLPELPAKGEPPIGYFPGALEGDSFVRRTPVSNPSATRAVFVHGMGGSSNNWVDLMYLLQPTFPGIALDLPGYGFSPAPKDGKYSLNRNAKAAIAVIESLDCGPVHLFGNSLGGITSIAVAVQRPDLVKSLILISPAMLTRKVMATAHLKTALAMFQNARAAKKLDARTAAEQQAKAILALVMADSSTVAPQRLEDTIVELQRRIQLPYNQAVGTGSATTLFAAAAAKDGDHRRSIWAMAPKVECPSLIVMGTEDHLVPVSLAPKMAAAIPGTEVVIWPRNGHVAMQEHPRRTAELALQWLGRTFG